MASVKLVERDDRGLVTRVIEADESDPLLSRISALEAECNELRSRLSESEVRRATESNATRAEQQAQDDRTHALTCDLIGGLLKEAQRAKDECHRLREALDVESQRAKSEAARAGQYEKAVIRLQPQVTHLTDSLIEAEARLDAIARKNRQRRPKKLDADEQALEAFVRGLYK